MTEHNYMPCFITLWARVRCMLPTWCLVKGEKSRITVHLRCCELCAGEPSLPAVAFVLRCSTFLDFIPHLRKVCRLTACSAGRLSCPPTATDPPALRPSAPATERETEGTSSSHLGWNPEGGATRGRLYSCNNCCLMFSVICLVSLHDWFYKI